MEKMDYLPILTRDLINTIFQCWGSEDLWHIESKLRNTKLLISLISVMTKFGYLRLRYKLNDREDGFFRCIVNGDIITSSYILSRSIRLPVNIFLIYSDMFTVGFNKIAEITCSELIIHKYNKKDTILSVYKTCAIARIDNLWQLQNGNIIMKKARDLLFLKQFELSLVISLSTEVQHLRDLNDSQFFTIGVDKIVQLWCSKTCSAIYKINIFNSAVFVQSIKVLSDGLIYANVKNDIVYTHGVWEIHTGKLVKLLYEDFEMKFGDSLCIIEDKVLFYIGREVSIYDDLDFTCPTLWYYCTDILNVLYLDGQVFAVRDTMAVKLWDIETLRCLQVIMLSSSEIYMPMKVERDYLIMKTHKGAEIYKFMSI
jgi:hypothetical protein